MDPLSLSPAAATAVAALFGLLVGSFLNVVIHRLPRMLDAEWRAQAAEFSDTPLTESAASAERFNLWVPRSRCPHCGHEIRAIENVPVASWLVLRGRCSACGGRISPRYPAVELLSAALSALAIAWFGPSWAGAAAVLLGFFLVALTFIDLDTQLLPDDLTLPLLWAGLLLNLRGTFVTIESAVIGAAAGYLALWSVYWAFRLATGKEGMGYGDFKLLAALGAWFGWQALPAILLLSSVVGAAVGIGLIVLARHGRGTPIPFGPYLAGAGLLALYLREPLAAIYGLG